MKNIIVLMLALVAIGVMAYAGVNGILRDHSSGPLFIFLAACCATGLSMDITTTVKERIRRNNVRKFGRE
jgi:hypothetical protein